MCSDSDSDVDDDVYIDDDESILIDAFSEEEGSRVSNDSKVRESGGSLSSPPGSYARSHSTSEMTSNTAAAIGSFASPGTGPSPRSRFNLAIALMARAVRKGGDSSNRETSSPQRNLPPRSLSFSTGIGKSTANKAASTPPPQEPSSNTPTNSATKSGSNGKLSLRFQKFVATRLRYVL